MMSEKISQIDFSRHYGVAALPHYQDFCDYVTQEINEITDPETSVTSIRIESSWKDAGRNRHAAVRAEGTRRDEQGELGGEIVWLVRSKTFRGKFWSRIAKRTDLDYYSQAREAIYRRDYAEFRRLANFIHSQYEENRVFRKMLAIAERQKNHSEQEGGANALSRAAHP